MFYKIGFFKEFRKIHRKTSVQESLFENLEACRPETLFKRDFSRNFFGLQLYQKVKNFCFRESTILFRKMQCARISSTRYYNNKIYFTNIPILSLYQCVVTSIGNSSHTCSKCV